VAPLPYQSLFTISGRKFGTEEQKMGS